MCVCVCVRACVCVGGIGFVLSNGVFIGILNVHIGTHAITFYSVYRFLVRFCQKMYNTGVRDEKLKTENLSSVKSTKDGQALRRWAGQLGQ